MGSSTSRPKNNLPWLFLWGKGVEPIRAAELSAACSVLKHGKLVMQEIRNLLLPDLANKIALVTGASGGIGAEIVRMLALQGSKVVAVDKNASALLELRTKLLADGFDIETYTADVSEGAQIENIISNIDSTLGPLNYLVNAAGVLRAGPVVDFPLEDWNSIMRVNATGVFLASQAAAANMIKHGTKGSIVTVASNAAQIARTNMAAYAASKAAAISFTKCLGLELAAYGIRCNVVAPGSTDTDMLRDLWGTDDRTTDTLNGSLAAYRSGIPLKRIATPMNIATTILFLLSDSASHITLQTLTVDGGATLGA